MTDDRREPESKQPEATEGAPKSEPGKSVDSFGNKVEKSPWLIYALLQIPLVLIMVVIIWVMYRNSQG